MLQDQDGDGLGMAPRPGEPESALEPGMSAPRKKPRSGPELTAGKGIAPLAVNIPDTSFATVPAPQPGSWTYDFDPSGNARASFNGDVLINGQSAGIIGPLVGVTDGGFINKLRNGTFDVWQRGTSVTTVVGNLTYTADGWFAISSGAAQTCQQGAGSPAGTRSSFGLNGAAGNTSVTIGQRIESYLAAALANQIVTFQALIYNNTSGPITVSMHTNYPTATDNWASSTTDLPTTVVQSVPVGVWTKVAYTWQAANQQKGYAVYFDFPAIASGNIDIAAADLRVTPSLAIGLCLSPPPPELRNVAAEQAFCQRYYQSVFCGGSLWAGDGNGYLIFVPFPVVMRATPTIDSSGMTLANQLASYPQYNATADHCSINQARATAPGLVSAYGPLKFSAEL